MSESTLISFKNTKRGQDKKGRDTLVLYMTQEQAQTLMAQLEANIGNERGVKLALHSEDKEAPWGGMATSTFGFVNAIEAPGANYNKGAPAAGQGKGKFVPKAKTTGMSATTKAKAASTLNTEVD
jgi:hypothetical protein